MTGVPDPQSHMLNMPLPSLCLVFHFCSKGREGGKVKPPGSPRTSSQPPQVGTEEPAHGNSSGSPSFQDMGDLGPECAASPWELQAKPEGIRPACSANTFPEASVVGGLESDVLEAGTGRARGDTALGGHARKVG